MQYYGIIAKFITLNYPQILKIVYSNRFSWSLRLSYFSIFNLTISPPWNATSKKTGIGGLLKINFKWTIWRIITITNYKIISSSEVYFLYMGPLLFLSKLTIFVLNTKYNGTLLIFIKLTILHCWKSRSTMCDCCYYQSTPSACWIKQWLWKLRVIIDWLLWWLWMTGYCDDWLLWMTVYCDEWLLWMTNYWEWLINYWQKAIHDLRMGSCRQISR